MLRSCELNVVTLHLYLGYNTILNGVRGTNYEGTELLLIMIEFVSVFTFTVALCPGISPILHISALSFVRMKMFHFVALLELCVLYF